MPGGVFVQMNAKDGPLPAPMKKSEVGIKQIAFVEKSDLDKSITIIQN